MLADTTIYLTPYRSREQIVSGALTFAIVAGCADRLDAVLLRGGSARLRRRRARRLRRSGRARVRGRGSAGRPGPAGAHPRGSRGASVRGSPGRRSAGRPPTVLSEAIALGPPSAAASRRTSGDPSSRPALASADAGRRRRNHPARRRRGAPARLGVLHRRRRTPRDRRARAGDGPPAPRAITACWPGASASCATRGVRRRAACATSCPTTAAGWTARTPAITSDEPPGHSVRSSRRARERLCSGRASISCGRC